MRKHLLMASAAVLALGLGGAAHAAGTNHSSLSQTGLDNDAYVNQVSATNNTNSSTIVQVGNHNKVGTSISNGVSQSGTTNKNTSTIHQGHTTSGGSHGNMAQVTQRGNTNTNKSTINQQGRGYNTARVKQGTTRSGNDTSNGEHTSNILQDGYKNSADVAQYGTGENTSRLYQYGNWNSATITQWGAGTNNSTVRQGSSGAPSSSNTAIVSQYAPSGATNTSYVTQAGAGSHYAYVYQH